jgi:predicted acetyltransferase
MRCHQRAVSQGQASFDRGDEGWAYMLKLAQDGLLVVDRPGGNDGPIRSWMLMVHHHEAGRDTVRTGDHLAYDSVDSLRRQLHFLASLRDQYLSASLVLPADVPLNWLLRERQVPHRPVNHDVPAPRLFTRMQVRVLDHVRLLEAIPWPKTARGKATIGIRESEGNTSTICLDVSDGRASARAQSAEPEVRCTDAVWAAVALGELTATQAHRWGLVEASNPQALALLDALAEGPVPFSHEYF